MHADPRQDRRDRIHSYEDGSIDVDEGMRASIELPSTAALSLAGMCAD